MKQKSTDDTETVGQVIWSHRLCWNSPAGTSYTGVGHRGVHVHRVSIISFKFNDDLACSRCSIWIGCGVYLTFDRL